MSVGHVGAQDTLVNVGRSLKDSSTEAASMIYCPFVYQCAGLCLKLSKLLVCSYCRYGAMG